MSTNLAMLLCCTINIWPKASSHNVEEDECVGVVVEEEEMAVFF
jgi:hypothetical protein